MNFKFSHDKLLKIAKEEFISKGYEGASLREIAKKCDLSTGAIYGNFKNKEALFKEIIEKDIPKIMEVFKIAKTKSIACNKKVVDILKKGRITKELINEAMNMYEYMYENRCSFIMIYSAKGTKFEKIIRDFTKEDVESTIQLYKNVKNIKVMEKHVEKILSDAASECFEGAIPFLIEYEKFEEAKPYLELYIKCYIQCFLFLLKQ